MKQYDYTKLKALREEKGLTQGQVGDLLGIGQSAYNKLETGNRKRKNDSIFDIEKLAEAFELTPARLISILTDQVNVCSSGMKEADLWQVHKLTKKNPLREDEFILFTTPVLELEKHDFKKHYSGINLTEYDDDLHRIDNGAAMPIWEYPPTINLIVADCVEIECITKKNALGGINIWLGNKKLGVIDEEYIGLVKELIGTLLLSRVALIENDESVAGYFDTYMKLVFIASNAISKTVDFKKGRFSSIRLLTKEEIRQIDSEL